MRTLGGPGAPFTTTKGDDMSDDTPTIDPRNNPESQVAEEGASQTGTRSTGDTGVVMSDAPAAEDGADGVIGGRITGVEDGISRARSRGREGGPGSAVSPTSIGGGPAGGG